MQCIGTTDWMNAIAIVTAGSVIPVEIKRTFKHLQISFVLIVSREQFLLRYIKPVLADSCQALIAQSNTINTFCRCGRYFDFLTVIIVCKISFPGLMTMRRSRGMTVIIYIEIHSIPCEITGIFYRSGLRNRLIRALGR